MAGPDAHSHALAALDVPPGAVPALAAYLRTLDAWAARINLTGARTTAGRIELLVQPIVPLATHLLPGPILDIGSGNGSPGLVLAALRPDLPLTLLEPRQRRWAFLREAARAMGRSDVEVLRARHDAYAGPPVANVVVRAVALPLAELAPLVLPGGQALVIGRAAVEGHEAFPDSGFVAPSVVAYRRRST